MAVWWSCMGGIMEGSSGSRYICAFAKALQVELTRNTVFYSVKSGQSSLR